MISKIKMLLELIQTMQTISIWNPPTLNPAQPTIQNSAFQKPTIQNSASKKNTMEKITSKKVSFKKSYTEKDNPWYRVFLHGVISLLKLHVKHLHHH